MAFSCVREKISKVIAIAERFTGKNITLPVLGNVLLEFGQNSLRVVATNLEHAIQITLDGSGSGEGRITIPAKVLSSFLQSLKEDTVELEEKQGTIHIKTALRDTKIHGVSAADFPLIPKVKNVRDFTLPMRDLGVGLTSVLPAVSQSDFKPELNGVLFKVNQNILHLAATDTFRLAEKTLSLSKNKEEGTFSFILPSRSASEIARVLTQDENGGTVKVVLDENQVLFDCDTITIISRLIDGKFPDYIGVIPKQYEVSCTVSRQDIHDAVRASTIFASKLQDVSLQFQNKSIEVFSSNHEVGEYKTKADAVVQGKNLRVNFNHRYLLDGLGMLHENEIFVGCNTEQSPVLLRDKTDGSFVYIVMPIRAL